MPGVSNRELVISARLETCHKLQKYNVSGPQESWCWGFLDILALLPNKNNILLLMIVFLNTMSLLNIILYDINIFLCGQPYFYATTELEVAQYW